MTLSLKTQTYKSDERLAYTPVGATTAGTPVQVVGTLVGIPPADIAANATDEVDVVGRFRGVKKNETWDADEEIGWDADGDPAVGTAGSGAYTNVPGDWDFPVGLCVAAAAAGDEHGIFLLNRYSGGAEDTSTATFGAIVGGDASLGITGQAAASATSAGGAVAIAGAAGGATSGAGGAVSLTGGAATAGNDVGGASTVAGGAGQGTGNGGVASVTGGASGTGATGNGGASSVVGGAAASTNGNGGAANVTGGVATGTGTGGAISITSGASAGAGGTAGDVTIDTGAAAGGTEGGITIGSAVTKKIGLFGATPVVQPAHADQGAVPAATTVGANTGTAGAGLSLIGDTTAVDQSGALMNDLVALQEDIVSLRTFCNQLRTDLVNLGAIKGAA